MSIEELDTKQELGRWLVEYLEAEGLPMTAVQGLQETITPGKFNLLTLENGWANWGAGYRTTGYMTIPGNGILLCGLITGGASGTQFAQLPAGAWPKENLTVPANDSAGSGAVVILSTGQCIAFAAEAVANFGFAVTFYPSVT